MQFLKRQKARYNLLRLYRVYLSKFEYWKQVWVWPKGSSLELRNRVSF